MNYLLHVVARAGEVLAWGINDFGQLGNGSTFYETSPTKVVGLEEVRTADIVAGGWHSLALTTEGGVLSCLCRREILL